MPVARQNEQSSKCDIDWPVLLVFPSADKSLPAKSPLVWLISLIPVLVQITFIACGLNTGAAIATPNAVTYKKSTRATSWRERQGMFMEADYNSAVTTGYKLASVVANI